MLVVFRYTTRDDLFVDMNGTGMFTIGSRSMMMLTPINVRLMTYIVTYINVTATHWLWIRIVITSTYYATMTNSRTITVVLMNLALLLTTVKTKLPRVLGRQFYPLLEPLTLMFNKLLDVTVHPLRIVRQYMFRRLDGE